MIRARLSNGAFILGIDAENVRRLQAGFPILVDLSELGGTDTICLMYGATLDHIKKELEEVSGSPLPAPHECTYMKVGKRAKCVVCGGKGGRWCPTSPSHQCVYAAGVVHGPLCEYCNQPEEDL